MIETMISAVVAAAGLSSRFGGHAKQVLPFGEATLLHRLLETLSACGFAETVLVVGHKKEEIAEAARAFPAVRRVENPHYGDGLGASLACGVRTLKKWDGAALFLADKPFVRAETVRAMLTAFREEEGRKIVHPSFRGEQGHPVVFPARFKDSLEALDGERGAKHILAAHARETLALETFDAGVVEDVDTPGAYEALRAKYERG